MNNCRVELIVTSFWVYFAQVLYDGPLTRPPAPRMPLNSFGGGEVGAEVDFGNNIKFCSIPMLMKKITSYVSKLCSLKNVIREEYPLFRAIQFAAYWGEKIEHYK